MNVPFFRPEITSLEEAEVLDVLRSGWLTTGSRVARFEQEFARAVGAEHAVALSSATAALHLAVEALGLRPGQGVLVPTMTFAATAEVVRYMGAVPILVDCEPGSLNIDLSDAELKLQRAERGALAGMRRVQVAGIMPVHVGGAMADVQRVAAFAARHGLWVVEDAAHAFPAAWRPDAGSPWIRCGERTAAVTCFSFYANKTITTGEGGMAVTADAQLAERMRLMSLHGLSKDAWQRYSGAASWDYRIVAPGFKYNLTDLAAAIGIQQLARAEQMRARRAAIAARYDGQLAGLREIARPETPEHRIHAWHLYPVRLSLDRLSVTRDTVIDEMRRAGIGCSVHWRPLHLHPLYEQAGWTPDACPVASREWRRLISLPIFPTMTDEEVGYVCATLIRLCAAFEERPGLPPYVSSPSSEREAPATV